MLAVWLRVRAGLRQDWRSPLVLALITGLVGGVGEPMAFDQGLTEARTWTIDQAVAAGLASAEASRANTALRSSRSSMVLIVPSVR